MVGNIRQMLQSLLDRKNMTIEELAAAAETLLAELTPSQTRYKVNERPDVRTIRYYTTQKLLPKPVSYQGGRARYAGTHLIRLLLIKKRQAEQHTLARIAQMLRGTTDEEVLRLIFVDLAEAEQPEPIKTSPRQPLISETRHTVALSCGARLDLPAEMLTDPAARRKLMADLQTLIQQLEAENEGEFT